MFKKLLATLLAVWAVSAFAATDVNKADAAELQTVRGIGASTAGKILDERKKGDFKDWNDLVERVPGVGPKSAARLSAQGLTVNGAAYSGAAPDAKPQKADKPEHHKKADKAAAKE